MYIKDPELLERYIAFLIHYQGIRVRELQGEVVLDDPVIAADRRNKPHRLEDIFRKQNHLTRYELEWLENVPFEEQVRRILLFRHTWSPCIFQYLILPGCQPTKEILLELKDLVTTPGDYIYTGIMWPFIHTRDGKTREDNIIDHFRMVEGGYRETAQLVRTLTQAKSVIAHLYDRYSLLGPFRIYEVFTSLCYLPEFPFTSDDYLFVGPGSKAIADGLFGKMPSLEEMLELRAVVHARLMDAEQLGAFDFNGNSFDLKALEDGFCEFRKYESMKQERPIKPRLNREVRFITPQIPNPWSLSWPLL
jgi:hypothetical protein